MERESESSGGAVEVLLVKVPKNDTKAFDVIVRPILGTINMFVGMG